MNNVENKIWDWKIILCTVLSILLILFSFIAPKILITYIVKENYEYDFSQSGAMGSALSGTMNPFIALAGILVTFLAFYIQLNANRIQIKQFENEKQKVISEEKKQTYNYLKLLLIDLEEIIEDIRYKAEKMREYVRLEKEPNLKTNLLHRTPSMKYNRILEIERLQIYKGFNIHLSKNDNWLKDYKSLYNMLDYFPELWSEIYGKYEKHSVDMFQEKDFLSKSIDNFVSKISKMLYDNQWEFQDEYLREVFINIFEKFVVDYHNILSKNTDENNISISEIDFNEINENVLKVLLEDLMSIVRKEKENKSSDKNFHTIENIVKEISDMRKKIWVLKNKKYRYALCLEKQYKDLMEGNEQEQSIVSELSDIKENIKKEIEMIVYEKL